MAGDELRRQVADHYARQAERYARFENARSRAQAATMLDALPLQEATRVLDLGTGPGTMLPELARRSPASVVVGVDASEGALRRARRDVAGPLGAMDSTRLGFAGRTFDVVTFSFSLFHLPDPGAGLREAARVLRPGGTVGLLTHDASAPNPPPRARALVEAALDRLGADVHPMPPVKEAATQEAVGALLAAAGFGSVRTWTATHDEEVDAGGDELIERARGRALELSAETWAAFERDVRAMLATLSAEDFRYRLRFVYATGTRRP